MKLFFILKVAGFTGANLRSPKIARITGLDTSGIAFNCLFDPNDCLDPSDADFVDEIHSLVSALPKGHADYYPIPKGKFCIASTIYISNKVVGGEISSPAHYQVGLRVRLAVTNVFQSHIEYSQWYRRATMDPNFVGVRIPMQLIQ